MRHPDGQTQVLERVNGAKKAVANSSWAQVSLGYTSHSNYSARDLREPYGIQEHCGNSAKSMANVAAAYDDHRNGLHKHTEFD